MEDRLGALGIDIAGTKLGDLKAIIDKKNQERNISWESYNEGGLKLSLPPRPYSPHKFARQPDEELVSPGKAKKVVQFESKTINDVTLKQENLANWFE